MEEAKLPEKKDGADGILRILLDKVSGASISSILDMAKNFKLSSLTTMAESIKAQIFAKLEELGNTYLGSHMEFIKKNRIVLIYGAIVGAILLLPIFGLIVYTFISIGLGLLLFGLTTGTLVVVGFLVFVVSLIPLLLLLLIIGLIVVGVAWIINKASSPGGGATSPPETKPPTFPVDDTSKTK